MFLAVFPVIHMIWESLSDLIKLRQFDDTKCLFSQWPLNKISLYHLRLQLLMIIKINKYSINYYSD